MIKKLMIFILAILLLFTNNTRAFASNHTDEFDNTTDTVPELKLCRRSGGIGENK